MRRLLLFPILLSACSPVQQGNVVLAVFRPDVLAEHRCYDREMMYDRATGACYISQTRAMQVSAPAPLAPEQQAYLNWLSRHAGPQQYSGKFLEMATSASPQFTHMHGAR